MSERSEIKFTRLDSIPSHIEAFAKELADHFKVRRPYVADYCKLIMTSKRWGIQNLNQHLLRWKSMFERIEGRRKIIDIVSRAFLSCTTQDEVAKLRGVMVEALIIGCNGGAQVLSNSKYGWGALVEIHNQNQPVHEVKYSCNNPIDHNCHRRSTVDFGFWNGRHGKFYECKAQPAGIGCKEVNYMKKLKDDLNTKDISHEIFFVCAERREEIEIKLKTFELSPLYQPFGIEDIRTEMPA